MRRLLRTHHANPRTRPKGDPNAPIAAVTKEGAALSSQPLNSRSQETAPKSPRRSPIPMHPHPETDTIGPTPHAEEAPMPPPRPGPLHGPWITAAVGLVLLGLLVWLLPNWLSRGWKSKRAELPSPVTEIATMQRAHFAACDAYAPAERSPRTTPDGRSVPWKGSEGFEKMGWSPDGPVRGVYGVEVSADGAHFTVHGLRDLDEDAERAEYTATHAEPIARRVTDDTVC